MKGSGLFFLKQCLDSIVKQDFKDYEVIVSDNSSDDELKRLVDKYSFKYIKSVRLGSSANTNNGMKIAKGELIKPMFQDDYFLSETCLSEMADSLGAWFAFSRVQDKGGLSKVKEPYWNPNIIRGYNTLSTPSCVAFPNGYEFDENLRWMMDVDLYYRLYKDFGEPTSLHGVVAITEWDGRVTEDIPYEEKEKEQDYINTKYNLP